WNAPVSRIDDTGDGATVRLADGTRLAADVVVVTAGAWTVRLVDGIHLPRLRVTEETPAHFRPRDDSPWPSFNHFVTAGYPAPIYGMPTPGEGVKVGLHRVGDEIDPDARPHRVTHADTLREYVREWMPGLDPDSAVHLSCTYTTTPDSAFVLDRSGNIVVGAGFSGHGFKFAPGVGETLARLALDPGVRAAAPFRLPG
ncbi:MAG TPA: FAD-dependent oxidoreductase, partial [Microbacterium sp.]|nr:FAD-dependent oxidoreductase [Microbacterium sp.]